MLLINLNRQLSNLILFRFKIITGLHCTPTLTNRSYIFAGIGVFQSPSAQQQTLAQLKKLSKLIYEWGLRAESSKRKGRDLTQHYDRSPHIDRKIQKAT